MKRCPTRRCRNRTRGIETQNNRVTKLFFQRNQGAELSGPFTTILLIGEGNLLKQLGTRLMHPDRSIWAHLTNEALAPSFARLGLNPIAADLSDPFMAKMTVANADVIYHLAGKRVHGRPSAEPTDLKILRNILSSLPSGSPKRYIFESSLEVYDGM